ncbi:MAG: hypothetical protein IJ748_02410 [Bacteroidales bacterium]|nr:hypothetical protein [Bacteroidales bacterium]
MNKLNPVIWIALLVCLFVSSCVNEDDFDTGKIAKPHFKPSLENNLIETEFKLSDFFNFESIADEENGITVEFTKTPEGLDDTIVVNINKDMELTSDELDDFINGITLNPVQLGAQGVDMTQLKSLLLLSDIEQTITLVDQTSEKVIIDAIEEDSLNERGARYLSKVFLEAGILHIPAVSLPFQTTLYLSSDKIKAPDGSTFDRVFTIGAGNTEGLDVDLDGYEIDIEPLEDGSGNSYFDIEYKVEATVSSSMASSIPDVMDVDLEVSFGQMWFINLAYGKLGAYEYPIHDTIEITYFDSPDFKDLLKEGTIMLNDINMNLTYWNNIGMDGRLDISNMFAENYINERANLFQDMTKTNPQINAPLLAGSVMTQTISNDDLGKANPMAINILPNKIVYDAVFRVFDDPNGTLSFVFPGSSNLKLNIQTRVPVIAKITDMESDNDIDDFSFLQEDGGVGDYLESVTLKLDLENSFPAVMSVNIILKDENGNELEPLFDEPLLISAANVTVDNNNVARTASPVREQINKTITNEKYQKLRQAQKISIKAVLNSAANDEAYLLFPRDASLKVKIGMKAQTDITL